VRIAAFCAAIEFAEKPTNGTATILITPALRAWRRVNLLSAIVILRYVCMDKANRDHNPKTSICIEKNIGESSNKMPVLSKLTALACHT
jgi:hypothetical protein